MVNPPLVPNCFQSESFGLFLKSKILLEQIQKQMKKISLLMLAFIACFATSTFAQSTADEVLASHFEAMGGLEKMKAIKSLKMTGKVPTPQGDFKFTVYSKAPNLMRTEVDIQGKLMIPQAYDGTIAWTINPFAGGDKAQKLPEEQAKEMVDEATMESALINYKEKGHKVELEGKEEVDGAEAFKLKLTKYAGKENEKVEYHFIDAESFAPIMTRSTVSTGPRKGNGCGNLYE